jgi:hypothetical protein
MKENYEIKLISIGAIFTIVGTIIKLVEVGKQWPFIIMWLGWVMLSIGLISLFVKKLQREENKR